MRVIFNITFLLKWTIRKIELRKGEKSDMTQRQANILFENDEANMGKSMSVMLVFLFTILFYAPIIPGITMIGIIGSTGIYWTMKYLILRRKVVEQQTDGKLFIISSDILKVGVFANALMGFIFFDMLLNRTSIPQLFALLFSTLFFILPVRQFLVSLFVSDVKRDDENYYRVYKKFKHYDLLNPITKSKGNARLQDKSLSYALRRCMLK